MNKLILKLSAIFPVVLFIAVNLFQPSKAQGATIDNSLPYNWLTSCTVSVGPLTAGYGSTTFSYGSIYKIGASFICPETEIGKQTGIGDFNNDGKNDIVMALFTPSQGFTYNVLINYQDLQGNLSTSPTIYWAGLRAESLAVGDLNHDGLDDFAVANMMNAPGDTSGVVRVFLQQLNGTMIMTPYPALYGPDAIAIGDVTGDGLDDIAISSWGVSPNFIGVYVQNQDGSLNDFVTYPSINAGYDDIAIGDVNQDGLNDVVKLNGQGTTSDLLVYLQNPNGSLDNYVAYSLGPITTYRGTSLAIGDVTGDGLSDVIVPYAPDWDYSHLAVFAQDANGALLAPVSYLSWSGQEEVEIADINNDGLQDVVTSHWGWQTVGTYTQRLDGTLDKEALYRANYSEVNGISLGDLNNDALIDIFVSDSVGYDVLYHEPIFSDLPPNYWASSYINRLYLAGVTGGCSTSPLKYCPDVYVNRAQMAVFLLRGEHGSSYIPSYPQGTIFGDVAENYWAAAWIEKLFEEGITGGCGNGNYCPEVTVTRDQMAVFLLRAKHGAGYTPPEPSGVFSDVPTDYWAAAWIEQLAAEGVTSGCGDGKYCPTMPVTRMQMAIFLTKAFNLP